MALVGLQGIGLIERDSNGDVLWTWVYPSISDETRQVVLSSCCIASGQPTSLVPFVYIHFRKQWLYLHTEETAQLDKVTHVCLVLVTSDFNLPLYSALCRQLMKQYTTSASTVSVLETYLEVFTRGRCGIGDNGAFAVSDYDMKQYVLSESKVKDVVHMFGVEFIVVFTALLLKKRIVVHHPDGPTLASICSTLPVFVWHRLSWNGVYPIVQLLATKLDSLQKVTGGYIAGFTDSAVELRTDLYDVFVNASSREITISPNARETFAMGKLHRDLATFITQCVDDDDKSDAQCIQDIATKTRDLINNLKSLTKHDSDGDAFLTVENIREKHLPAVTENFLLNLTSVEGLLKV